jgi:hypothetical protein
MPVSIRARGRLPLVTRTLAPPTEHEIEVRTIRQEAKAERRQLATEWYRRTSPTTMAT